MARAMTKEEHEQGWCELPCGKHAWVFRAEVLRKLKVVTSDEYSEFCPEIQGPAVKLEILEKLKE